MVWNIPLRREHKIRDIEKSTVTSTSQVRRAIYHYTQMWRIDTVQALKS